MIVCEIIVHLLVLVQNNERCTHDLRDWDGTKYSGLDSELERSRKTNENVSGDGFLVVVKQIV